MSSATLARLAEHINEHHLVWACLWRREYYLDVQLHNGSTTELARWASTLDGVVWKAGDFRETAGPGQSAWHVHAAGELDGDVKVWCGLPAEFADTADEVCRRMATLVNDIIGRQADATVARAAERDGICGVSDGAS